MSATTQVRPVFAAVASGRRKGFLLVAALLLVWEISARGGFVLSDNWPPFTEVLIATGRGIASGELVVVLISTLYRTLIGYSLGVSLGILVGVGFAVWPIAYRLFDPLVELLRPIPVPAVIPPLILFLGVDDPMKISIVAFTAFFPVLINTVQGARGIERTYLAVATTFRLGPFKRVWSVILPAILPYILSGMRISLALALIVAVVGEMIAGNSGIGHYLVLMQFAARGADMYAAIILLSVAGYALNYVFLQAERRLIFWYSAAGRSDDAL